MHKETASRSQPHLLVFSCCLCHWLSTAVQVSTSVSQRASNKSLCKFWCRQRHLVVLRCVVGYVYVARSWTSHNLHVRKGITRVLDEASIALLAIKLPVATSKGRDVHIPKNDIEITTWLRRGCCNVDFPRHSELWTILKGGAKTLLLILMFEFTLA